MGTINNLVTAARLMEQQGDGYRCELIRGEVVRMSPTGSKHGVIAHRIGRWAGVYRGNRIQTGDQSRHSARGRCRPRAK